MSILQDSFLVMQVAMQLVPALFPLIKAVEAPGNGVQQAQFVSNAVVASLKLLPPDTQAKISAVKIADFIQEVTSAIVTLYNATGIFTRSTPPATAPTAPPVVAPVVTLADKIAQVKAHITKLEAKIAATPVEDAPAVSALNTKLNELHSRLAMLESED